MKNVVSTLATLVLLTLVSASAAFGQMAPPKEGAVAMGTFRAPFKAEQSGPSLYGSVSSNTGGTVEVVVWMMESGESAYTLNVNTAEFNMPCGWAKKMETSQLIDMMAQGAIAEGIRRGYTIPSPNCGDHIVDVYYPTCISRTQGWECPGFTAQPGSDYSINGYSVCGDIVNPLISLVYTIRGNSICDGDFSESTTNTVDTAEARTASNQEGGLLSTVSGLLRR